MTQLPKPEDYEDLVWTIHRILDDEQLGYENFLEDLQRNCYEYTREHYIEKEGRLNGKIQAVMAIRKRLREHQI